MGEILPRYTGRRAHDDGKFFSDLLKLYVIKLKMYNVLLIILINKLKYLI